MRESAPMGKTSPGIVPNGLAAGDAICGECADWQADYPEDAHDGEPPACWGQCGSLLALPPHRLRWWTMPACPAFKETTP